MRRRTGSHGAQGEPEIKSFTEGLVTLVDPNTSAAEAYRTLRTNLLHALVDNPPRVIIVTSPGAREGKSTTCANLGVVLAQAGKNTLIIDCDLRKPALHAYFALRNLWGIVDVLIEERNPQEVWHEPIANLKILTVGTIPPNPTEILDSQRFAEFITGIREDFDYVLLDAPPVGLVSDPTILATKGDGVLLVLDAQNTRKVAVRQSIRSLRAVGANVFGTVMNNVKGSKSDQYYYDYTQSNGAVRRK